MKLVHDQDLKRLNESIIELQSICAELDPYSPIDSIMKARLKKFHIVDFSDPFHLTNTLILLLEDALELKESLSIQPLTNENDSHLNKNT